MSAIRRQAAETMRQRLSTTDNTTLGQLERLDLFIESNADLQPHRDALYLSDLDILFPDLQHKITSLRDNIQLPLFEDYTPASTPNFNADEPNPRHGTMKYNNTTLIPIWAILSVTSPE